jgi:hypothetical protein
MKTKTICPHCERDTAVVPSYRENAAPIVVKAVNSQKLSVAAKVKNIIVKHDKTATVVIGVVGTFFGLTTAHFIGKWAALYIFRVPPTRDICSFPGTILMCLLVLLGGLAAVIIGSEIKDKLLSIGQPNKSKTTTSG